MTGILLVGLGVAGAALGFSTLAVAVCLALVDLALDVSRRRPLAFRLIDIWRLAFVYLFGSEAILTLPDVRDDFGVRIASASEGLIVAAFGASLLGYKLGGRLIALPSRGSASSLRGNRRLQLLAVAALSTLILLYLVLAVSPSALLVARSIRGEERPLGPWSVAVVAAMVVQSVLTAQCIAATRDRALLAYPMAVSMICFAVLYLLGTRYFLGFFASGALFYFARFGRPVSRREIGICIAGVLVLSVLQGTMRLVRHARSAGPDTSALASSLADVKTYSSTEGMLRVHAWIHQKDVFSANDRVLEHAFLLYWWVPRSIWPSKPTMDGYWLAREVMADGDVGAGHSVAGGFALPALLDFGPWRGIAFCLLYGLIIRSLERFMAMHSNPADPASVFAALLPFAVFFAMRSPQTSAIFLESCMAVYLPIFLLLRARARYAPRVWRPAAVTTVGSRPPPLAQARVARAVQMALALLLIGSRAVAVAEPLAEDMPSFAVQLEGAGLRAFRLPAIQTWRPATVTNADLKGVLAPVGVDEWELTLASKRHAITAVWFPWSPDRVTSGPGLDTGIVYYPRMLGVAVRGALLSEWGWQGGAYPGECFAPLVVVADDADARMVAATNWPPRRVSPMYSLGRIALKYDSRLEPHERQSYRALVVQTKASTDAQPWQQALDRYKAWLKPRIRAAGLEPSPPPWLRDLHGWMNVQLQNAPTWDPGVVYAQWDRWKTQLPWMQFWGQMSGYYVRGSAEADRTGCCLNDSAMHPRYKPELLEIARRIAREGRIGFYARPPTPYGPLVTDDALGETAELAFLRAWLHRNRAEYGANAFYVDVLGHRDFGDPLRVARLLQHDLDPATVIEYPVDVYPATFLVSGSLGGGTFGGGPGRTPDQLAHGLGRTTAPAFGRYLLDDRLLFLGESNGDHRWWGPAAEYWTERQAFLLGAKFDVMHATEDGHAGGPENRALALAIAERDRVGWWRRDPVYFDRRGLEGVPANVDIRRYRGRDGETLLVVDNWAGHRGLSVTLDGHSIALPDDRLAILVVPRSS